MSVPNPSIHRSTKGASKQRRDHINMEIQKLRDLLPLSESVKDRLFQLQIMSLSCIFIRRHTYLPHILGESVRATNNVKIDSCQALRGFLLMVTRQGKSLYISENAADYLGHSVEEIMSQGDNIYDLVDPRDHSAVQAELLSGPPSLTMNGKFPDERFVLVEGRYLHPAEYYQALFTLTAPDVFIHPVFAAFCQPLINPENAEFLASGNTSMFRSVHRMDMRFIYMDDIGAFYLGCKSAQLEGQSWYSFIHPCDLPEVSFKHKLLCEEKEGSVIMLIRLRSLPGAWLWLHTVLAVKNNFMPQPQDGRKIKHLVHATYQLLSDLEAATLQANSWIYSVRHNYTEFSVKQNGNGHSDYNQAKAELPRSCGFRSNSEIRVEIPNGKANPLNLSNILTPDNSSPEINLGEVNANPVPSFGSIVDRHLPEIDTDDLEDYFVSVERRETIDSEEAGPRLRSSSSPNLAQWNQTLCRQRSLPQHSPRLDDFL